MTLMHAQIQKKTYQKCTSSDSKRRRKGHFTGQMSYHVSQGEKYALQDLHDLKISDRYSFNISRFINLQHRKITVLTSHDCHILIKKLHLIALQGSLLVKIVCPSVLEFYNFYKSCVRKNIKQRFDTLEKKIFITLHT